MSSSKIPAASVAANVVNGSAGWLPNRYSPSQRRALGSPFSASSMALVMIRRHRVSVMASAKTAKNSISTALRGRPGPKRLPAANLPLLSRSALITVFHRLNGISSH
jgi:hypothetical protein